MASRPEKPIPSASFDFGEHVRYVGLEHCAVPAGQAGHEVVLAPGMVGVVILTAGSSGGCHCRVQFKNGFQLDVTPDNWVDFESTHARRNPHAVCGRL